MPIHFDETPLRRVTDVPSPTSRSAVFPPVWSHHQGANPMSLCHACTQGRHDQCDLSFQCTCNCHGPDGLSVDFDPDDFPELVIIPHDPADEEKEETL